eukprot:6210414-Pleurochrysis_carterae.AAC.1
MARSITEAGVYCLIELALGPSLAAVRNSALWQTFESGADWQLRPPNLHQKSAFRCHLRKCYE